MTYRVNSALFARYRAELLSREGSQAMFREPGIPGLRGTCPCCGTVAARLRPCPGCPWSTIPGGRESRDGLREMRPDIARHAFTPIGCLVCDTCRSQMTQHPSLCPLRVFHDVIQESMP